MTRVLALTAVDLEARGLARQLGLAPVAGSDWPHFRSGALEVLGVGLRAGHLEDRIGAAPLPALVVSAGTCGALAEDLAAGDLVVPEVVVTRAGARYSTAPVPPLRRHGTLLGVPDVVETGSAKARLWFATGALACDMESAVILEWAQARGVPAAVVRAVADTARRGVSADLAEVVAADGRVRPMRAIGAVLLRPGALAEAIALRQGTSAALRAVAAALARIARGA